MKKERLYEGKAKTIYSTEQSDKVILQYKDDATAFNGIKKETISGKGKLNNLISSYIFKQLEQMGIKTHYIQTLNELEQLCYKIDVIPLEFICRNQVYGSMSKRLGIPQGTALKEPVFEISYKNDDLGDPLINDHHALALNLTTKSELIELYKFLDEINQKLQLIFSDLDIILIDFKIELGHNELGEILLADEISPDSCRLLDTHTNQQLDKDLFRHNSGNLTTAYQEIVKRIENHD